jgi:hypothetical protein
VTDFRFRYYSVGLIRLLIAVEHSQLNPDGTQPARIYTLTSPAVHSFRTRRRAGKRLSYHDLADSLGGQGRQTPGGCFNLSKGYEPWVKKG